MTDGAWVIYDHDHGPYAIELHDSAEAAAKANARMGYGRIAFWAFGVVFTDAINEWEGR